MRADIVTIFPEYFAPLDLSLIGKARAAGLLQVELHDLRNWTSDVHRTVDDTPYGGGPGMVLMPEPVYACVEAVRQQVPEEPGLLVLLTPAGERLTQAVVQELQGEKVDIIPWSADTANFIVNAGGATAATLVLTPSP